MNVAYSFVSLLLVFPWISAAEGSIGICEIVQHAERYDGKIVTVSGIYFHGRHGASIARLNCGFQNRYKPFGAGAAADFDRYQPEMSLSRQAQAVADRRSFQVFDDAVAHTIASSNSSSETIEITVVALVKVATKYKIECSERTGGVGTGYGFMGRDPVQLVVLKIDKFNIVEEAK